MTALASPSSGIDAAGRRELLPTGALRVGVVRAPAAGVFFVEVDTGSRPIGVTVDLGTDLARLLDVDPMFEVFPNSGECTEALAGGRLDVAFMPVDEFRRSRVDFGPAYYLLRSTFLVAAGTGVHSRASYQERGKRFVGIAGTTTLRAAERTFGKDRALEARSVDEALERFASGDVDAVALSEDYLRAIQPDFPGSELMADAFQETGVSIAVGKGKAQALGIVSTFLENAKETGQVRLIFDRHGLAHELVAPVGY